MTPPDNVRFTEAQREVEGASTSTSISTTGSPQPDPLGGSGRRVVRSSGADGRQELLVHRSGACFGHVTKCGHEAVFAA